MGGGVGTVLGLIAAYRGGWVDNLIMRIVDIKLAFPSILLALVLVAVSGPGFQTVVLVTRSPVVGEDSPAWCAEKPLPSRQQDFIARAQVAGASPMRIMVRHIFPNVVNTVVVLATLEVGHVIILESTLSFLGAGLVKPTPAWGLMVADGRALIVTAWWLFFFPTLAIVLTRAIYEPVGRLVARPLGSQAPQPSRAAPVICMFNGGVLIRIPPTFCSNRIPPDESKPKQPNAVS